MARSKEIDVEAVMRAAEQRAQIEHEFRKSAERVGAALAKITANWRAAFRKKQGYDRERAMLLRVIKAERKEHAVALAAGARDAETVVDEFISYRGRIFDALAEIDMVLGQRSITAERKAELRQRIEVLKDESMPAAMTRVYRARADRALDGIMESLEKLDDKPRR